MALFVNKHLLHDLKMLHTDRRLACCRLPVARSPQGQSQVMVVVELPPREQGRSYVLGLQARLIFSYICCVNLVSAFFQRAENDNLFY